MKLFVHLAIIVVLGFGWLNFFSNRDSGGDIDDLVGKKDTELRQQVADGELDEEVAENMLRDYESELNGKEATNSFTGLLLGFLTAGYVGVVFVTTVLPALAHKATHAVYDSGEEAETDPMHDARAFIAQGEYESAIEAFREAAKADPMNRLPYVEIAKLQMTQFEDTDGAIQTLTGAIEGQSWEENDAAFLMFRLAEIYKDEKNDIAMASAVMQQVIDQFPATRHSANANHKLQEWKAGA